MAFDSIAKIARPVVQEVIVRYMDASPEQEDSILKASRHAGAHAVSFVMYEDLDRCDIVCPACELAHIDTLIAFYAGNPFGCPKCGPEPKHDIYQQRIDNPFRTITRKEWEADVAKRLTKAVWDLPEDDRGPVWGLIKRIKKQGVQGDDYRRARDLLAPDEALLE